MSTQELLFKSGVVLDAKLELTLLPSRVARTEQLPLWLDCYRIWDMTWSQALKELDGLDKLHSDSFIHQDFLAALTYCDRVAGLCCFKTLDLRNPAHRNDSWFAPWPRELLTQLGQNYFKALVPSWLTVAPTFRRSNGFVSYGVTDLLAEIIHLSCFDVGAQIGFGTPRKDRSVHRSLERAGAVCLRADVLHHGVLVDLVGFFPSPAGEHSFSETVRKLWHEKRDFRLNAKQREDLSIWEVQYEKVL